MAYNTPPTKADGDVFTGAEFNTYVRDNFVAGVPDIMAAKGDLAVASGPDAAARLAVGSNGQILIADSGATHGVNWSFPIAPKVRLRVSGFTLNNLAPTAIQFSTEDVDTHAFANLGTFNTRVTIPAGLAGDYMLIAMVNFGTAAGLKEVGFRKNGSAVPNEIAKFDPAGAWAVSHTITITLAAGDYIELYATQGSGGNINATLITLSVIKI